MSRSDSGKKGPKAKELTEVPESVHIFCSDMYTHDFVIDAFKAVEKDKKVTTLELEDLIQRNDPETAKAVVDLLVENTLEGKKASGRNNNKRMWFSITFIDCISDADSYREYLNLKTAFMANLKRRLALKGVAQELPIRFEAKIELHTMLNVMGVIQLLQAVERDTTIKHVRFPGFRGKEKDIPATFASMADPETMEWKQTAEIYLQYRRRNKSKSKEGSDDDSKNAACAIVHKCSTALEELVFSSSQVGESLCFGGSSELDLKGEEVSPKKNHRRHRRANLDTMKDESTTEVSWESQSEIKVTKLAHEMHL